MRALAVQNREASAAIIDVPVGDPGPGEVTVAVEAASVNGFDVAVAAGYVWDMLPHEFPVVLGRDFAGVVASLGADVTGTQAGDRVAGVIGGVGLGPAGTMAELFTASAASLAPVPANVTSVQAAAVGLAAVTALDAVTTLDVSADDVVLIAGATGGVGAFAVQLSAARGARVIATARPGEPSDFVRRLGAAEVVDFTSDLTPAVTAIAPDGVTKILHAAGEAATLAQLLAAGGHLVSVLGADPAQVGREDVTITSFTAEPTAEKLTLLLDSAATGKLTVPVAGTCALEQAAGALNSFTTGKLGKIVVTV